MPDRMPACLLLPMTPALQLTHLDIRGCHRACSPGPFSHLTQLQRLRRLVAKGCGLQQASVRTLAALPSLAELDLEDNPGLMALGELRSLSELQRLDVGHCWLEDAHLAPLLASLPQLQHVALDENQQLTVAVVEALAAGPAASSLQHLLAASLDLEWAALLPLLPQVGFSGGRCQQTA